MQEYFYSSFIPNCYQLTAEIKIHRSLHHTQIVKFEHFFEDHENVYILLEMCNQKVFIYSTFNYYSYLFYINARIHLSP